ncbi:MAG: fibronectin type III domain-containing protein [Elusimicrobia bacterium]|nr:fibronectin type III domain-containing protein [Elusimicrobiota bacterium]
MTGLTMRRLSTALAAALLLAALPAVSAAADRRTAHTATLLTTGDVLLAGGVNEAGTTLATAELYAATIGRVVVGTGGMGVARASHTATLMSNGCVLATGGNTAANDAAVPVPSNSALIYNPATSSWAAPVGAQTTLLTARFNHTATLLNDGRVLICGGQNTNTDIVGNAIQSCEYYTPTSCTNGSFTAAPNLLQARYNHTATLLKDGKVWFAGGRNPLITATGGYLVTTERFDPGSGSFQSASPMIEARAYHTATLMGDGKALVVGGYNQRDVLANKGITESAEIYDPISNSVTPAATMSSRRQSHASLLSADGTVTVLGGLGNITTTYISGSALSLGQNVFGAGSTLVTDMTGGVVVPTATINAGSSGLIDLDFLLNKPVVGMISNGEVWLSSPSVMPSWGAIRFLPASETNPFVGARINLAGYSVGCREPFSVGNIVGNCGNIQRSLPQAAVSQLQGQVVYYPRVGVALGGDGKVTGGTLNFSATIDDSNNNATITGGSSFQATVKISVDNAFIGRSILSGTLTLTEAVLVQPSSFTATLTGGSGAVPATAVTLDASGNAELVLPMTFSSLAGDIEFTGTVPQSFASGQSIPKAGADMSLTATANFAYTMNGANLEGLTFNVDVATVVIRKFVFADTETYNPKTNSWLLSPVGGSSTADNRYGHTATLLPNNDQLFFGGRACSGVTCATQVSNISLDMPLVTSEKNFAATTGLAAQKRAFHTSTLLPDGDILIAGGTNGPSILSHAELFTPATELFSPVNGEMRYVRDLHTATLLPNGRVLIAGGFTTNAASTGSTNTAEIYYPDTKRFIETTPMISSRSNHSAIMLPDGKVFVAGGFGPGDVITGNSEIFISTQSRWVPAATMPGGCERAIHATVQLRDGRILLIGGVNSSGPLSTVARYDPALNTWDCASVAAIGNGTPGGPFALRSHTATLLFDGRVLVAGGNDGLGEANRSFIYDPAGNAWTSTDPLPLLQPRFNHTATFLPNGNVMISGGSQRFGNVPVSIENYHVNASTWVTGGGVSGVAFAGGARAFHTMTLALNNKMYGIGGSDGVIGGAGVALYNSAEAGYFTHTPDGFSKDAPPSFRQSTISGTFLGAVSTTVFLPGQNMTVTGTRFRGGTEASGGGAASANSAFSFPHMVLSQVDGSGGAASQSNGGFTVDLTTQIFINPANGATLDTSLTVALPATSAGLPYGWYTLRMGANDIYSNGTMIQVGPAKPTAAPANLAGTAAGTSSMTWTWNLIAGVDGYNVYNATTGVFITSIPATGAPTFVQTGLAPSATTSIMVAGYTLSGDGPLTNGPTTYTVSTCPINVTIASVTFSDLLLYWGDNGNAAPGTIYEVTQSSDAFVTDVSTPVPRLFNVAATSTTITNLAANTTYYFRVQAFNLIGLPSSFSAIVSTRTRAPVTQPIVMGLTTISIDWRWDDPGGVTNYRVYNATNNVLLGTPLTNVFTEIGLGTNTEHSIRVSAVTSAGEGPLSPSASAYTAAATPGPFNPVVSPPTTSTLQINWTNNGNPLQTPYQTTLTEFASDGSIVKVTTTPPVVAIFSQVYGGLIPSTLYGYDIVAENGDGVLSDEPPVVFGSTYTLPAPPSELTTLGTTPTTISVGWSTNNNSSSATYEVTYSTDGFALNVSTAIAFSAKYGGSGATITGLVTGATYSVRVIASNPYGQLSQFSNYVTTRTFNGGAPVGSLQGPLLAAADSTLFGSLGNGRQVTLRAPAHAFPADVVVTVSSFMPAATLCPGATNIAFSIVPTPSLQPIGSLYFTFDYAPAELGTIPTSRALLLRYDPGSNTCVPLETVVDTTNGRMTARINHFSLFQVGQVPLSVSAETARVFPNPYYAGRDGYVTIDNVPPLSRVRIFTLRGEQVLDVKANSTGLLTWSGTNGSGRSVASGVYLVMVESGGSKKILKLAVIR